MLLIDKWCKFVSEYTYMYISVESILRLLTHSPPEVEPGSLQLLQVTLQNSHSSGVGQLQQVLTLCHHTIILWLLGRHLLSERLYV